MKNNFSRRHFLTITPLAAAGLWLNGCVSPQSSVLSGRPNSKFGDVQIGVRWQSASNLLKKSWFNFQ